MAKQVNAAYRRTGDILQRMRQTRLPFDIVWTMVEETGKK